MEFDLVQRKAFSEKVKVGVIELIKLNQIEDLDEFDAGLYISNVFERQLQKDFDLKSLEKTKESSLRSFLWSSVYNPLEIEKYENYIKDNLKD